MGTREGPAARGRRRGREISHKLLAEVRNARVGADVSGRAVAARLGWSEARYRRFESGRRQATIGDMAAVGAVLGLDFTAHFYPSGKPIRDKGQQALIGRFRAILAAAWQVAAEMSLPAAGDSRSWDLGLRLVSQRVGVEAETAIRDVQRLVRRMRDRERDGGMDAIVLVLADTRSNRSLLPELREALGPEFATSPRAVLRALREGRPVPGSGVILL